MYAEMVLAGMTIVGGLAICIMLKGILATPTRMKWGER
jgi:hypothetical protein